jgi:NarL family two-component system response regulator LiaR
MYSPHRMDRDAGEDEAVEKIRVLIVDDHPLFRDGVRDRLVETDRAIEVVGEAADGREAIELVEGLHPDVVLMDVAMPGLNGIEATRRVKARWPEVSILGLTVYDDEAYVVALLEAGAAGYLLKTVAAAELAEAIHRVHEGEAVLSPPVARAVLHRFIRPGESASTARPWGTLSEREIDVLRLAAKGISNKEIAQELGLSVRTVHAHLSRVFDKLGVASRTEAVVYGLRRGWLLMEDLP